MMKYLLLKEMTSSTEGVARIFCISERETIQDTGKKYSEAKGTIFFMEARSLEKMGMTFFMATRMEGIV
ncbi:hypothetical protein D3C85_1839720 [compost metagenome]